MRESAHSAHRHRLEGLSSDARVLAAIAAAFSDRRDDRWRRHYGRFFPGAAAYAHLVFESRAPRQRLMAVHLHDERPSPAAPGERLAFDDLLGWVRMVDFPADDALPTLRDALALAPGAEVVRYRPGRRCTCRTTGPGGTRYGKVFPGDEGRRIHDEGVSLWRLAREGMLGFDVAQPIGWHAGLRVLWQREVAGTPVLPRLAGPGGRALAERMGRALATLPKTSLRPDMVFDTGVQMQRSGRYAAELALRVPGAARSVATLLDRLALVHGSSAAEPPRPIHGAPHANQWLASDSRLALVDFDRFALGDPELDVATFLGELDFEGDLGARVEDLAQSFVSGYEAVHGPLRWPLLAAYRAQKRLAKALRSARSLHVDGDRRALRHLARAHDALNGGADA